MIRAIVTFVVALSVPGLVLGNTILELEEQDLDGGSNVVNVGPSIVDINSTILVSIDKRKLREEISSSYDEFPSDQLLVISEIQGFIVAGMEALPGVQAALTDYLDGGPPTQAEIEAYFSSMSEVAKPARRILVLARRVPRLRSLINDRQRALPAYTQRWERQRATFQAAADYVEELERDLDQSLKSQGVYVQMGAWLLSAGSSRSIHLPGFDEYPLAEFDEIERWNLTALLSEENKRNFESAAQTAKQINEGSQSVVDLLSSQIPDAARVAFESVEACFARLDQPVDDLQVSLGAVAQTVLQKLDETKASVQAYKIFISGLKARYEEFSVQDLTNLPGLYQQISSDLVSLRERTASLRNDFSTLRETLTEQLTNLSQQTNAGISRLKSDFDSCQSIVNTQVAALQTVIGFLKNGKEISTASLKYTEKVLKHDLDSLPEKTRFDLRYSGARNPGDSVVLRISTGRTNQNVRHADERHLRLYKVLTYVDVAVSLIFVDPDDDFGLDSRFQAAPSYSVLLKRGSRDSTFKNELLQVGYGLNFAALDFNSNEEMELGVGLTVSAFRDYLQLGYGYNLNEDSGYWFLGFKFPLPGTDSSGVQTLQ